MKKTPSSDKISRRKWLGRVAAASATCALAPATTLLSAPTSDTPATGAGLANAATAPVGRGRSGVWLSRFMMKADFTRLEVMAPAYRFIWHGRTFGFRLISTMEDAYDERITYNSFGPFEVGAVDLVCNPYEPLSLSWPDGKAFGFGWGYAYTPEDKSAPAGLRRYAIEHTDGQTRKLRLQLDFPENQPYFFITFIPTGLDDHESYQVTWSANFIYDELWQGESGAGYYSTGAKTGLRVHGPKAGAVEVRDEKPNKTMVLHLPANQPSRCTFEILSEESWANGGVAPVRPAIVEVLPKMTIESVNELPSWEAGEMARHGWKTPRGKVKERVAGVFITAKNWRQIQSYLPETSIEFVSQTILPKIIESKRFGAVGLSRDGITERHLNDDWLALVAQVHKGGLRAYMKPGDGEITYMKQKSDIVNWAKACFDVAPEHRCDIVRLPNEAVLVPWVTSNLCLVPKFHTPEMAAMKGLNWQQAHERITTSVADRFSFVIDSIRKHAPDMTIDLESSDTPVLAKLLSRHENLGVMYMSYGPPPRVNEYLDLYYCVAKEQFHATRIVMETDCYYSDSISGPGAMKHKKFEDLYSEEDLQKMQDKHRQMCNMAADAAWAFGVNVTYTEEKFRRVCEAA